LPFQDDIFLDEYACDDQYTWVTIPVLKSTRSQIRCFPEYCTVYYHKEECDNHRGDTDNDSLEEEP